MNSNNETNIEKIYFYDEETAKRDAGRNSFNSWSIDDNERKKQYIIWGPITILILVVGFYLIDIWDGYMPLPLLITLVFGYVYLFIWALYVLKHPYKVKFSITKAYVLTKQNELYMIFVDPNKIGQNLAILVGGNVAAAVAFKGNKPAHRAASGATLVAVGINIAEKAAKLNKYLSDPLNIENILRQPDLMKELYVFKIIKTIDITEKKKYYKGKFLIYDYNKDNEREESLTIGKVYKDYRELINQLNLKR